MSGFGMYGVSLRWAVSAVGQKEYAAILQFVRIKGIDFFEVVFASRRGFFHCSGVGQLPKLW